MRGANSNSYCQSPQKELSRCRWHGIHCGCGNASACRPGCVRMPCCAWPTSLSARRRRPRPPAAVGRYGLHLPWRLSTDEWRQLAAGIAKGDGVALLALARGLMVEAKGEGFSNVADASLTALRLSYLQPTTR